MKRITALFLLSVLLMTACSKKPPEETLPAETEPAVEATEQTAQELEYAIAQADRIPVVLETLGRGDSVDIVKAFDETHYIVKRDVGYGLVEKDLVRLDTEPAFEAWTGYAYQDAKVYANYRLAGDPVKTLAVNTKVQVLDDLGMCFLVEADGMTGYMKQATLAKSALDIRKEKSPGSTPDSGAAGQDGGEISLESAGRLTLLATWTPQEGAVSGKATVLANETQVVLGYFDRGDKIPVVKQDPENGNLTVCLDGVYAQVPADRVRTPEEKEYPVWEGKIRQIISVYADCWMQGSPVDRLNAGTVVKVLFELENCYLVEAEGVTGYVARVDVTPAEPEVAEETVPETTAPAETRPRETKPTDPTEETEPEETTAPTESTNPAETAPTEATAPSEEPTEATKPSEPPAEATDPTVPATTEPVIPETTEPTEPETTEPTVPETTAPQWTPPIL